MKGLRYVIVSLLGAIGGIIGNLLAAIIENSLGKFTPLQAVAMVAGVILIALLTYQFETQFGQGEQEKQRLIQHLGRHRLELERQRAKYDAGVLWTGEDANNWQDHQRAIEDLKYRLRLERVQIQDEPIDYAPPPKLGFWAKLLGITKHITTLLAFPTAVSISLVVAFTLSPAMHLILMRSSSLPTPTPTRTSTSTQALTAKPSISAPTLSTTATSAPTEPTLSPTERVSPLPSNTRTPTALPTGASAILTSTRTPVLTTDKPPPTVIPTSTPVRPLTLTPKPVLLLTP